ncbi:MAG: type II secretion system F family protein [Candidatus Riflebacteria bacterium]|nr:type II secretion system F family protein [Candidatus Riflebacteria bacterium]
MPPKKFYYKASDANGKPVEGYMDAPGIEEVGNWLIERQYFVTSIEPASTLVTMALSKSYRKIPTSKMNYFFIQLSSLISSGCPLIMSLQALFRQLPAGELKNIVKDLKEKLEMGKSFSEALKSHQDVFSNLFITMVEVGEVGGILDEVVTKYSRIYDSMARIRSKFLRSMIYPLILMIMTFTVSAILLLWVFPVFVEKLEAKGALLPIPTRLLIGISDSLINVTEMILYLPKQIPISPWISGPIFIFIIIILIRKAFAQAFENVEFRRFFGHLLLNIPFAGELSKTAELSLFSSTLGTMLKCGVPILTSLTAVERAQSNQHFKDTIKTIREGIARGESVSMNMSRTPDLFPESLILMADVGERGGNIGEMLERASIIFERELEGKIEIFVSLVEPALVLFLSLFVVLIALAMYLPLFDIIKVLR